MTKPKITVGFCVRNCENFIKEAVDSVFAQDFPHELMELVFVDDGSEDKTLSIIKNCVSMIDIPSKIFHTSWKGLGHARNLVVANAEGNYILWVDGDMILSKDYVREQVTFMEQQPQVAVAKGKQALNSGANLLATLETYSRAAGRMVDYRSEKSRSKCMGTGGCIYRVNAIRQVNGFDENIIGYGEDFDAEHRIRAAGWSLCTTNVQFSDYERHGLTWNELFRKYLQRGYDLNYFMRKNKGLIRLSRMLPPVALLAGLFQSFIVYKLTRRKVAFMLPFQCALKSTAWCLGFLKASFDS
jgi:glycosyltransferase involved in cell wall biosynthesis